MTKTPPTDTGACATKRGYLRHGRAGERACDPCRAANTEAQRLYYHTPSGKAAYWRYQTSRRGRATQQAAKARYRASPKGRATRAAWVARRRDERRKADG